MIVQVLPFDSHVIGVPVRRLMASLGEGPSTPISSILTEGVPPPSIATPKTNIPATHLTPFSRVVQPPASTNVVGPSSGVVTGIPSAPFASPSFAHTS